MPHRASCRRTQAHKSQGGLSTVAARRQRAEEGEVKRASVCERARVVPGKGRVTPGLRITGASGGARTPLEASKASRRHAGRAAQTIDRSPDALFVAFGRPRPITAPGPGAQTIHSLSCHVNLLHASRMRSTGTRRSSQFAVHKLASVRARARIATACALDTSSPVAPRFLAAAARVRLEVGLHKRGHY